MQKIFQEYGGVITVAIAIVALIGVVGLMFTGTGNGWMENAFVTVKDNFLNKAGSAIDEIEVGGNGGAGTEQETGGATFRDGTFLTWAELQLTENGEKYGYDPANITNTAIAPNTFFEAGPSSVVIPEGVTSIGAKAFYDGYLDSITIPQSVTFIGEYFAGCLAPEVTYLGKTAQWEAIEKEEKFHWAPYDLIVTCTDGVITVPAAF